MSPSRPPSAGVEQRRRRLLVVLRDLGGEATPAELVAASGIAPRTLSRDLSALVAAGLVGGTEHRRRLAPAGWDAVSIATLPVPVTSFDDAVREVFGPYHAALVRRVVDAVVAHQLGPDRGWAPSFAACGPRGTGKTAVAVFVCWALGLDPALSVRHLPGMAPGEVVGRRRQLPGGEWAVERSALVDLPFACLDEWADDPQVRREALRLVHGETVAVVEGERIELRPTVLLTFNTTAGHDPRWPLPEPYWRRCLVAHLDDGDQGLGGRLDRFYAIDRPAALRLDAMAWPGERLPDTVRHLVDDRAPMRRVMSDAGRLFYGDVRTVETLALGRLARLSIPADAHAAAAVWQVVVDVLTVAETIDGHVTAGWRPAADDVRRALAGTAGVDELAAAIDAGTTARAARTAQAAEVRRDRDHVAVALIGRRAELAETFTGAARAIERVPAEHRPRAAGLRKQLRTLAHQASEARSGQALDDLAAVGAPVLDAARQLHRSLDDAAETARRLDQQRKDQQKQAAEQRRAAEARAREAARLAARQAKQRQQARDRRLAELRPLLRRKTTRAGEDVLGRLVELHAIEPVSQRYQHDARSLLDQVRRRPPRWVERTRRRYQAADGTLWAPDQLRAWEEPAVRQVLAAAVAAVEGAGPASVAALPAARSAVAALGPGPSAAQPFTGDAIYGPRR